ncbi:MAG: hypothetical protein WED05_03315 [Candidatus Atabeyarchaeum deiterrae]
MFCDPELKISIPYEYVKDPIYGYIRVYEHEHKIIDTESFQRLRRIKQLAAAHYVYPGATHTRFSHSLGVMHLSGLFVKQLLESCKNEIPDDTFLRYFFLMRLWGLTHDLGHGPYSHTFDKAVLEHMGINHEYMSSKIVVDDNIIAETIEKDLSDYDIRPKTLSEYLGKTREEWPKGEKLGNTQHNESSFYYVLKGSYSTDIIDYLLRDNLYTGAGYGNFDWQRLILSSCLHGDEVALDVRARDTLDALLLSRLFSFNTIYYHRWSRAADHVMRVFLSKANKKIDLADYANDVEEYKKLDEESILQMRELTDIPERKMLLDREIPFREIDRRKIQLSSDIAILDEDNLNSKLSETLESRIPSEAYFVDTPNLPLNPMRDEDVCIVDHSSSPTAVWHEPVRKTSWGEVPYSVWIVRLYLDKKYEKNEEDVKRAFQDAITGKKGSHF